MTKLSAAKVTNKSKDNNKVENFAWAHMTVKDIEQLPIDYISHKKSHYKEIKSILPEHRTFKNTVLGLEHSDIKTICHIDGDIAHHSYSDHMHEMHLLSNVSPNKDLREAAQKAEVAVHQALIDIEFDRDLYTALLEYYHGNYEDEKSGKYLDEDGVKHSKLDADDIRLFEHMMRDYKRMGFALDDAKFKQLKKLLKELTNVSSKFRVNINNYNDYILINDDQLDGCSDRYVNSLEQIKDKDNNTLYKISLDYPESGPYMGDAKCREKRKELADKLAMKGGKSNLKVLGNMVELRLKVAKLLGYKNYVDYKVEERMAKNSKNVLKFVNDLIIGLTPLANEDLKELRKFAATELHIKQLEYYDLGYAMKELGKKMYKLDNETLRTYFPTEHVLSTMFDMFGKLFGFKVKEINGVELWHKDAKAYDVISTDDGDKKNKVVANLILDLYPRPNKYGHAAAFDTKYSGTKVVTLLCNFPKATPNTPSLMSLGEVETIFHEFGHAMHFMLSDTKYKSHNGFHVAWDFVEAPSQIMEEWVMDAKVLKILGKNYKTGKRLDDNTIQNIIASKKLMQSYGYMRQLIQTKLDLDIHLGRTGDNYTEYYRKMMKKYFKIDISPKSLFPAGFGHMDGYDSGYYSYLWAEVYAADFFSKFKGDVFNQEIGRKYRKEILSVGASRDEAVSARKFLGRISTAKAFLDSISK